MHLTPLSTISCTTRIGRSVSATLGPRKADDRATNVQYARPVVFAVFRAWYPEILIYIPTLGDKPMLGFAGNWVAAFGLPLGCMLYPLE